MALHRATPRLFVGNLHVVGSEGPCASHRCGAGCLDDFRAHRNAARGLFKHRSSAQRHALPHSPNAHFRFGHAADGVLVAFDPFMKPPARLAAEREQIPAIFKRLRGNGWRSGCGRSGRRSGCGCRGRWRDGRNRHRRRDQPRCHERVRARGQCQREHHAQQWRALTDGA